MRLTRRRALLGAMGVALSYTAKARFLGFAVSGSGGGTLSAGSVTFVNDGASTQPSGQPTQSFGWIFPQGLITGGAAPVFTVSGVTQPFSASVASMRSYWPDGSLKYAQFALRPTFSLGAGASQAVSIAGGGSWPSASSRTLAEVNSQALAASFPAASPSGANLTGTWGAWCDTSGNSANLINSGAFATVVDMDGDAGKRWTIHFNMSQTKGGAAHGQLVYTFYVWLLNNSSGGLGGCRWSGYARQPWYNLSGEGTTVPAKNLRAFATPDYSTPTNGPNWTASGVSATNMGFRGSDGNAITAISGWTVVSDSVRNSTVGAVGASGNNWALGAPNGSVLPCYFTTTGTLPTPLSVNNIYFALVFSIATGTGSYQNLFIYNSPTCGSGNLQNLSGGSGTHTIHPIVGLNQFCRVGFKDDNGRYLFFAGTGTGISAETTLREQIDQTAWQKTGLIQPWNLSFLGSGSITDTLFSSLWNPHTIASCDQDQDGATGVIQCIGFFPNDCGLDFYKRTKQSERAARCMAETQCGIPLDFRDATTNSLVNLSNTTYTGLPSTIATTVSWGQASGGFTAPPTAGMGFTSVGSNEHQPGYAAWAWLRFGEPQYLEFMKEAAIGGPLSTGDPNRNTDTPVSGVRGIPLGFEQEYRTLAWRTRNMAVVAGYAPFNPGSPSSLDLDGTLTTKQIVDLLAAAWTQVKNAQISSNNYYDKNQVAGTSTPYITGRGIWAPYCDRGSSENGNYLTNSPEWEFAYIAFCACLAAMVGDANAQSFLINQVAARWDYVRTHFNLYNLPAYYTTWGNITSSAGVPHTGTLPFHRDQDWNVQNNYYHNDGSAGLSWSPGTVGTGGGFTASFFQNQQTPANGDQIIFYSRFQPVPGGLSDVTGYYLVNCTYNSGTATATFDVSATKGGSPISLTDTNSTSVEPGITSNNSSMTTNWSNFASPFAMDLDGLYPIVQASRWGKAVLSKLGLYTNQFDGCLTDFNFRLANTTSFPTQAPNVNMSRTLNSGALADVRYMVSDQFG